MINDCEVVRTEKKVSIAYFRALTKHSHENDRNQKTPQTEQQCPAKF
jgi:hypothetical protein